MLKNNTFEINNKECIVYVGEPAALIVNHTNYILHKQNESNVLIVGQDILAAIAIIYYSFEQIIEQSSDLSKFYICDKTNIDSDYHGKFKPLAEKYNHLQIIENDLEIENIINDVFTELEKRKTDQNLSNSRIILAFSDIYNIRNLRKEGYIPSPLTQKLISLLKDGSNYNIHIMIYANSYTNFNSIFESSKVLNDFEIKIELCNGDGYKIFDISSFDAQKITPHNNNIANIKTPQQKEIQKFKVYTL